MSATDPHQVFHRTIEAVWRIESARVIARLTRDLDLAEDLAQEALVAALHQERAAQALVLRQATSTLVQWVKPQKSG